LFIACIIKSGSFFLVKVFDDAVLLYAKIYGLDEICQKTYFTPAKFIDLLDNALSAFDHLAKKNNVIRIETISGYIAAGGLKEVDDELVLA
jgi:glycerate kinase